METAWYPFVINVTNQVPVSALNSLSVIAGNNRATLTEEKSVYAKFVFSCYQDIHLTSLYTVFIKTAIMFLFMFSMRWYVQYQLNCIRHFLQTTECANVQG